jgi:D-alanyl-D-alanine carboxypeptidase (penicillin-binding protein 5/6)
LAHLLRAVLIDGDLIDLMRTKQKIVRGERGQKYLLKSTNSLLGELEGLLGGKTGYTLEAGEVLISAVKRNGKTVIIALLNSGDRAGETRILVDWVFENFVWEEVIPR